MQKQSFITLLTLGLLLFMFQTQALDERYIQDVGILSVSSEFSGTNGAAVNMVNGSGIVNIGAGIGAQEAQHAVGSIGTVWDTTGAAPFPHTVLFSMRGKKKLGKVLVWNCNEIPARGANDVLIEYTNDLVNYIPVGNFNFAQATAAQIPATDIIDLGGIEARFVRFTITSNHGDATYTSISEVRFYEESVEPDWVGLEPLQASSADTYNGDSGSFGAKYAIGKQGMWENAAGSTTGGHEWNSAGLTWIAVDDGTSSPILELNFFWDVPLQKMLIWNTKEINQLDRQVVDYRVEYKASTDGAFTTLGDFTLDVATNNDTTTNTVGGEVDLTGIVANEINIIVLSNNGNSQYSALGEVRVYGNFDPAFIQNVEAACPQGFFGGSAPSYLVSDWGILYDSSVAGSKTDLHTASGSNRWLSSAGNPLSDLEFDLGKVETLKEMVVWNNNAPALIEVERAVQDINVNYKVNATDPWTPLGSYTLTSATFSATSGADPIPATDTIDFGGIDARYVQIDIQSTYGDIYSSLAEVRFYRDFSPAEPTNVGANSITATAIEWNWTDNATDEEAYHVFFGPGATAPTTSVTLAADSTTYSATGLTPNTNYAFQVAASRLGDVSTKTATVNARTLAAVPNAPAVTNQLTNSFNVAVSADSNPAGTEYAIRVVDTGSPGGNEWVQTDGTLGAAEAWQSRSAWGTITVNGLTEGSSYDVTVKARNADNVETVESAATSASTGVNLPAAPTSLTLTAVTSNSLSWGWEDNATNEDGYKVFLGVGTSTSATAVTILPADSTAYSTDTLAPNTQYALQVAATNAGGDSAKTPALSTYTLALEPVAPALVQTSLSSLALSIPSDGNPAATEYAIQVENGALQWVQPGGALGAAAAWQPAAGWAGTEVDSLSSGTLYLVRSQARNGALIPTGFSPDASFTLMPPASADGTWTLFE